MIMLQPYFFKYTKQNLMESTSVFLHNSSGCTFRISATDRTQIKPKFQNRSCLCFQVHMYENTQNPAWNKSHLIFGSSNFGGRETFIFPLHTSVSYKKKYMFSFFNKRRFSLPKLLVKGPRVEDTGKEVDCSPLSSPPYSQGSQCRLRTQQRLRRYLNDRGLKKGSVVV